MTALCTGGGPSQIKPGAPANAAVTVAGLDYLLTSVGLGWLVPFISGFEVPLLNLTTFCQSDPPAIVPLTLAEVLALASPIPLTAGASAISKIQAYIQNAMWATYCECVTGAQPTFPNPLTSKPSGVPVQVTGQSAECVQMLPTQCRVLNLWAGSTNAAPPTNWDQPTFDDHTWAIGTAPDIDGDFFTEASTTKYGVAPQCDTITNCQEIPVAPWVLPTSGMEQFLIRWRVTLPAGDPNTWCIRLASIFDSGGGWSSGTVTIDGTSTTIAFNGLQWQSAIVPSMTGGDHLFAIWVNSGNTTPLNTWGGHGAVAISFNRLGVLGSNPSTGCCPPDPAIASMLQQINSAIQLLQRQLLPFGYVAGTAHPLLQDQGTIAVSDLIGILVQLTTIPGSIGTEVGSPDILFDAGWVSVMSADGLIEQRRVNSANIVWTPRLMGESTVVGYSFAPNVVATITELQREP